jgi:hypothetical protein
MQYQGCELEESLLFTLLILAAETYNLLHASTALAYPISIIIVALYTLLYPLPYPASPASPTTSSKCCYSCFSWWWPPPSSPSLWYITHY